MRFNVKKIKDSWRYSFWFDGKQTRRIVKARNQEQAKIIAQSDWDRQFNEKHNPQPEAAPEVKEILFADFVNEHFLPFSKLNKKSYDRDKRLSKIFCEFFAGKTLKEIKRSDIESFKLHHSITKSRYGKILAPATVNRELAILSRIFSLAIDDEILPYNPCQRVKNLRTDNQRIRYLTEDEEKRLLAELKDNELTKNIVIFAINTGMRRGEIFSLTWFDADLNRNVLNVRQTKTGKDRVVPMNDKVRLMLDSLPKTNEFVFTSPRTGGKLVDVKKGFRKALEDAKIFNFHFHDLRHTFATRLADAGVPLSVIAELLGHSDIRMTKRYSHATDRAKRDAVEKLTEIETDKQIVSKSRKKGKRQAAQLAL
jgi:integrase